MESPRAKAARRSGTLADGLGSPERGALRVHHVRLALSDYEWSCVEADAAQLDCSVDTLLSLVVAFGSRANIHAASCLALADITRPWAEQAKAQ